MLVMFCFLMISSRDQVAADSSSTLVMPDQVRGFLDRFCVDCHEGASAEAGLDLSNASETDSLDLRLEDWVRIHDRVAAHEMPPPDEVTVSPTDAQEFLKQLCSSIERYERVQHQEMGRVRSRRLTNLQLERTLHDLLAIDRPLANLMPKEPRVEGFNGIAESQSMSHFLLQNHLDVVDAALKDAMRRITDRSNPFRRQYDAIDLARDNPRRRCRDPEMFDGAAVVWSSGLTFYGRITSTTVRESGWYRIKFSASAVKQPLTGGVWCSVRSGQCTSGAPLMNWIGSFEATEKRTEHTMEAWLPAGHMIEIRPADVTLKRASFRGGQVGVGEGGPQNVPGVALHSMEMKAIYPSGGSELVQSRLFGNLQLIIDRDVGTIRYDGQNAADDAEIQLRKFVRRAFRRQLDTQQMQPYLDWLNAELKVGKNLVDALLSTYRSILCSPRFLYFVEPVGHLDADAIASRLSYLVWNSMPDDALFEWADGRGTPSQKQILSQVGRLIKDPKGRRFIADFSDQWLDLADIDFTEPDRKLHRDFDVVVQNAMLDETHEFLQSIFDRNAPAARLLDADYTYLNSRLARYYGIGGVQGDALRRVKLTSDSHRGGLLAHGSLLKVTANGTNTSPVLRGVWVSERLLGIDIPPPPENVPAVEPDIRGARTIREQLELHLSDVACQSCHIKTDPAGYALENFDAAGRWRTTYPVALKGRSKKGPEVDASGSMPDGRSFEGFEQFRQLLSENSESIARNFAEKLIVYGTGHEVTFSDRRELEEIIQSTQSGGYGVRSILNAVVTSSLFLTK